MNTIPQRALVVRNMWNREMLDVLATQAHGDPRYDLILDEAHAQLARMTKRVRSNWPEVYTASSEPGVAWTMHQWRVECSDGSWAIISTDEHGIQSYAVEFYPDKDSTYLAHRQRKFYDSNGPRDEQIAAHYNIETVMVVRWMEMIGFLARFKKLSRIALWISKSGFTDAREDGDDDDFGESWTKVCVVNLDSCRRDRSLIRHAMMTNMKKFEFQWPAPTMPQQPVFHTEDMTVGPSL